MPCRLEQVRRQVGGDLEVALAPEELESMDEAALTALYQRRLAEEKSKTTREVGSCMAVEGLCLRSGLPRSLGRPGHQAFRRVTPLAGLPCTSGVC